MNGPLVPRSDFPLLAAHPSLAYLDSAATSQKPASVIDAIAFIVEIAIEAEVMNHHPEFHNSYNIVSFSFCTHDVGHKITDTDIKLAEKISETARRFISMK